MKKRILCIHLFNMIAFFISSGIMMKHNLFFAIWFITIGVLEAFTAIIYGFVLHKYEIKVKTDENTEV